MTRYLPWALLLFALQISDANANDSFGSEFSHFAGNAALASATTVVVDKYWPEVEKPAWVGFTVSASEAFLGEFVDYATGGDLSWLDFAAGTLGAATGAYFTDKLYIAPKLNLNKGNESYGMVVIYHF